MSAIEGLATLGAKATAAIPALQKLTADKKFGVRAATARTLKQIQSAGSSEAPSDPAI